MQFDIYSHNSLFFIDFIFIFIYLFLDKWCAVMAGYLKFAFLFFTGIAAGFINVNAGGGSSLTLPVLLFLGLDASVANGTNRIGIVIQTLSSVSSFKKQTYSDFKTSLKFALCTLPGAIAGALISVRISDELFKKILGIILIGIIFTLFLKPGYRQNITESKISKSWLVYPLLVLIGFYGGFIQVGVGFLLMSALYYTIRISLVKVNMHKVFIILFYTLPTIAVFALTQNLNLVIGLVLGSGMAIGGWWGARFAVKKGDKFIRWVLAITIIIIVIKLLYPFTG